MTIPQDDPDAVDYAARIRVTSGSPTPVEVAAVTAVVAAALEQLAEEDRRREDETPTPGNSAGAGYGAR
ncbi:hypothetical protein GCM10025881_11150 [Pseudolysinimonas kribbensis]|uniref:Acyl-CoA carboxylase subunit epsilon n=1 Tax=Pseudolysinimonas kribbensis TaxID=433641 RepID=A0ABQ6K3I0_9MICO|nr:acyl-CoA carboxylase epsilon subunit [Pseudolysinimonas kribbensis]GMA94291.1 hypothetical protein GCM10025881_11150 [Pseudolysinimonas kribbensis]